jgi:hypothetical protein
VGHNFEKGLQKYYHTQGWLILHSVFREEQCETFTTYHDMIDGCQKMAKAHIVSDPNIFSVTFSDDGLCT